MIKAILLTVMSNELTYVNGQHGEFMASSSCLRESLGESSEGLRLGKWES